MWMNDIEYEFVSDSAAKKNVARGARNMRTHNGRRGAVKFPSDYLTKKELKAMNGKVINYASLKGPMTWQEFKDLPNDLKKEYIGYIRTKFGAPDKYIAEMFGVSQPTLALYLTDAGCASGKGAGNGSKKWAKEQFFAWRSGAEEGTIVTEKIEPENSDDIAPNCGHTDTKYAIPVSGAMDFSDTDIESIIPVLRTLLSGAKLNFHVSWTVDGTPDAD